jgi:cytochrome c oxidase assembly factor CtaG
MRGVPFPVPVVGVSPALRWTFEPAVIVALVLVGRWYLRGARIAEHRRPAVSWRGRTVSFVGGLVVLLVALESPIDTFADDRLSIHMVQHVLLTLVAPPLLLFGRPLTLWHAASSPGTRHTLARLARARAVRFVSSPAFGLGSFGAVLWVSHLSPLYEASLTNSAVHAAEHAAYLGTAMSFWWPVVAKDPGSARLSYPGRLLYVFLAMPVMSLLGFVVSYSDRVLYPHYLATASSAAAALADQRLGGTIMWESSMLGGAIALSIVLIEWMRYEDVLARRADARLERARRASGTVEAQHG